MASARVLQTLSEREARMNEKRYSGREVRRRRAGEEEGDGGRHMTGAGEMDHNYVEWTERRRRRGEAKNRQRGDRGGEGEGRRVTTKMLSYSYSTEYLGRILVLVLF